MDTGRRPVRRGAELWRQRRARLRAPAAAPTPPPPTAAPPASPRAGSTGGGARGRQGRQCGRRASGTRAAGPGSRSVSRSGRPAGRARRRRWAGPRAGPPPARPDRSRWCRRTSASKRPNGSSRHPGVFHPGSRVVPAAVGAADVKPPRHRRVRRSWSGRGGVAQLVLGTVAETGERDGGADDLEAGDRDEQRRGPLAREEPGDGPGVDHEGQGADGRQEDPAGAGRAETAPARSRSRTGWRSRAPGRRTPRAPATATTAPVASSTRDAGAGGPPAGRLPTLPARG